MAADCQWRSPAADQQYNDASDPIDTAPEPPSAPSTPEQPTRSISRLTPSEDKVRELLDTQIIPRALWATENGMEQEQALMIVAVHDAGFLLDALAKVRAQWPNGVAAALAGWETAQAREQTEEWRQAQPQRVQRGARRCHHQEDH